MAGGGAEADAEVNARRRLGRLYIGTVTLRVAGLASHNGTNLRHLDAACRAGEVDAELVLVVSNNGSASILSWARDRGVRGLHLSSRTHPSAGELDDAILAALSEAPADVVFLSGYMKMLGLPVVARYRNRIMNIHPALLPGFGGPGMYGDRVYEAVLSAGETETGATIHLVDEQYDHGPAVMRQVVPVDPGDGVDELRAKVRECERRLTLRVFAALARGEVDLDLVASGATPAEQL